jgi:acyl dehydratase
MRTFTSFDELTAAVGEELGTSDWLEVDQARIDAFADCTGDRQWIHVDVERAKRESPFGGTIAHGYLTLSLAASLAIEAGVIPLDAAAALNYGLDKTRFLHRCARARACATAWCCSKSRRRRAAAHC